MYHSGTGTNSLKKNMTIDLPLTCRWYTCCWGHSL